MKLAPVFDAVAPFLAGKMSLGKIDCTSQKKTCKRFDVKGYPTLKYYRDGEFQDYPLGRDKDSIITFGEKMSTRAVKIVSTHDEAKKELLTKSSPVAYVVYDPDASSSSSESSQSTIDASGASAAEKVAEKLIQSTERTRVFGQAARMMQAQGSFGMLMPAVGGAAKEEIANFFDVGGEVPTGGFIARVEEDVPTKLYEGELTTLAFSEWASKTNLAAVIELGGHNFRFVSRRGKSLAVAVYDPDDEIKTANFQRELKQYAVKGAHRDDYIFATMDGKRWDKFVSQFSITKDNLPELFVIDVPAGIYWQDASVFGISDFVSGVKSGEIESREQEKRKEGPLDEFLQLFVDYMPYSLGAMLALFAGVFFMVLRFDDGGPNLPPPPRRVATSKKKEESENDNKKDK